MNALGLLVNFLFSSCSQFSIVTYNIHGLPMIITGDNTYNRVNEIGMYLENLNPDVIHIQEDWTEYGHKMFTDPLGDEYISNVHFDKKLHEYSIFGSGLFSSSKFYSEEHQEEIYSERYGYDDVWASKGFIVQRLSVGNHIVDFYNTHMDAQNKKGDQKARKANAEQLVSFINEYSADFPIIVAGDTNLKHSSGLDMETYEFILSEGNLTDVSNDSSIDKILYSNTESLNFISTEILPIELSDHDAIKVTFELC